MLDCRRERRRRCLLGGKLTFNHRHSSSGCVIRNISTSGAMMVLPDADVVPITFDIHIAHWRRSFRGTIVWRQGEQAGVALSEFIPTALSHDVNRRAGAPNKENRNLQVLFDL